MRTILTFCCLLLPAVANADQLLTSYLLWPTGGDLLDTPVPDQSFPLTFSLGSAFMTFNARPSDVGTNFYADPIQLAAFDHAAHFDAAPVPSGTIDDFFFRVMGEPFAIGPNKLTSVEIHLIALDIVSPFIDPHYSISGSFVANLYGVPIPEPSTLVLCAIALLTILATRPPATIAGR